MWIVSLYHLCSAYAEINVSANLYRDLSFLHVHKSMAFQAKVGGRKQLRATQAQLIFSFKRYLG